MGLAPKHRPASIAALNAAAGGRNAKKQFTPEMISQAQGEVVFESFVGEILHRHTVQFVRIGVLDLSRIASHLGLSKSLQKVKFGGVVGKQTYLGIFGVAALAVIAFRADSGSILFLAICAVVIVLGIAILNYAYAHQHPTEAMMEGSELLALQHHVLAAKGVPSPSDAGQEVLKSGPIGPNEKSIAES